MQPATYQSVDADAGPPVGWGDGIFGCFNDMQVCLLGFFPLGCVQYLYAVRSSLDGRRKKELKNTPQPLLSRATVVPFPTRRSAVTARRVFPPAGSFATFVRRSLVPLRGCFDFCWRVLRC